MKRFDHGVSKGGVLILFLLFLPLAEPVWSDDSVEDTMLLFVGESLDVMTIASRREESAWEAPAVARVVTRGEFLERGWDSLSRVLSAQTGFYMAPAEWGTRPYLRGIPDSFLLLYDAVPAGSSISKSLHPLDQELSLAPIKRIEIISGPGSVLWGPDAFAGIVNLVPLSGADLGGVETGFSYGSAGDECAAWLTGGDRSGAWDWIFSLTAREYRNEEDSFGVVRFWETDTRAVSPDDRYGTGHAGNSRFMEASGSLRYDDRLQVSGRIADSRKAYMVAGANGMSWSEERDMPSGHLKLEWNAGLDHNSALRATGCWTSITADQLIIDRHFRQKEDSLFGELLYDRTLWAGRGQFTAGVSRREIRMRNIPVRDGYLPDYLVDTNPGGVPLVSFADYDTRLFSLFWQYRHRFDTLETWFGLRRDDHDSWEDRISLSGGISWQPDRRWGVKLLYGTAYRTPFAKQLRDNANVSLENIESVSLQTSWRPAEGLQMRMAGFWSRLEDHMDEKNMGGLSLPNHREFYGAELDARWSLGKTVTLTANATLIESSGPQEVFRYLEYILLNPDGSLEKVYSDLSYPCDIGPEVMWNAGLLWRPQPDVKLYGGIQYAGPVAASWLEEGKIVTRDVNQGGWHLTGAFSFEDVWMGWDMSIHFHCDPGSDDAFGGYGVMEAEQSDIVIGFCKAW
ncbi:MAG: hypothetical protein CSB33_03570 [Desulfobacterales bacterium]|nr:MAG: hypothetical protein CSB33_03570 [Desulfobacterales bacterium]